MPEDPKLTMRRTRVEQILVTFSDATADSPYAHPFASGEVFLEVAGDLVADIFHAARHVGTPLESLIQQALFHFEAEQLDAAMNEAGFWREPGVLPPFRRVAFEFECE